MWFYEKTYRACSSQCCDRYAALSFYDQSVCGTGFDYFVIVDRI